jgi:hypothetical protein
LALLTQCSGATGPVEEVKVADPTLPSGVMLVPFTPDRFAGVSTLSAEGGCSQTHVFTNSESAVVLTFGMDETVTGCRALRHTDSYFSFAGRGGDLVIHEQQGLRGRYTRRGAWIDVSLGLDDSVCKALQAGSPIYAKRAWRLECLSAKLVGVSTSALACRFPEEARSTSTYAAGGLVGDASGNERWLVLASGNGAVVSANEFWNVGSGDWHASAHDAHVALTGDAWDLLDKR